MKKNRGASCKLPEPPSPSEPLTPGTWVRSVRQRYGLPQKALAALLDVPRSTISKIEHDKQGLLFAQACTLARTFEVSLDDYLGLAGRPVELLALSEAAQELPPTLLAALTTQVQGWVTELQRLRQALLAEASLRQDERGEQG